MTAEKDALVWDKVIKAQVNNMTNSIAECDKIIKALE